MATYTTKLQLKKPESTDTADIEDINDNMEKIESAIQYKAGDTPPTSPFEGMIWLKPRS